MILYMNNNDHDLLYHYALILHITHILMDLALNISVSTHYSLSITIIIVAISILITFNSINVSFVIMTQLFIFNLFTLLDMELIIIPVQDLTMVEEEESILEVVELLKIKKIAIILFYSINSLPFSTIFH